MSFRSFVRGKRGALLLHLAVLLMTGMALSAMQVGVSTIAYLLALYAAATAVGLLVEYLPRRSYYRDFCRKLASLEDKQLLCELVEQPPFPEGALWYAALQGATKAMNDRIAEYERASGDYREYIETWVHEVKTPIASAKLLAENNPSPATRSMGEELERIDQFIEQALFYSRSNSVEKDYFIQRAPLKALVNSAVRKQAAALIAAKVRLTVEELAFDVFADPKWTDFILGQILSNAVKYRRGDCNIAFCGEERENTVALFVRDNGAGIPSQDLGRVFDKGFTGSNGRGSARSTGMGLYLCRKLCGKLGLGIAVRSREGEGTEVELLFPKRELLP